MRYLLLVAVLLFPLTSEAITGPSSRFDFAYGSPAVTANQTSTCNGEATARFGFAMGQPAVVHYAGVTCTVAAGGYVAPVNSIIWISED